MVARKKNDRLPMISSPSEVIEHAEFREDGYGLL